MVSIDRRSLFAWGAGAALLAGQSRSAQAQAESSQAQAPQADLPGAPGWHSFRLGDFQVTTILDGLRPGEGPHPIFGENQPAEAVAALLQANLLPPDRFVNGFTPTLVRTGTEAILFDTGLGAGGRENGLGQTRARLEAAGVRPEDVTLVVITHMHGDHIGGLMEGGAAAFPNARYAFGRREFDFWTAPERASGPTEGNAKAVAANVAPLQDRASFFEDGGEVAPGITALAAYGHTPGHTAFRLDSGGKSLMLTADAANHYVASLQRPDWHVRFDMDKEQAAETRKRVFGMLAAERMPFIGYHMPFPGVGYVEAIEGGFRWVPETYQLEL